MEEVAVRANMALEHKNFVNDFDSSVDNETMEEEYKKICAQVDKITLKFFFEMIKGGKPESALDLVHRLHLEQSYDIATNASDRFNFTKLSDRIISIKEERFNQDDDDSRTFDGSLNDDFTVFSQDAEKKYQRGASVSPELTSTLQERDMIKEEYSEKPKSRKRINPFATNSKKSPAKAKHVTTPTRKKPALSRLSTFSAESRRRSKASKEIL